MRESSQPLKGIRGKAIVVTWIGATLLLSSCQNAPLTPLGDETAAIQDVFAAKVPFLIRPRSAEAGALRSFVIAPATQPLSRALGGDVESSMLKLRIAEQPYYRAVKLDPSGRVPSTSIGQLAALAKQNGVDGSLALSDANVDVKTTTSQEERLSCAENAKGLLCKGNQVVKRHVSCTEMRATAVVGMRVVRASDATTVFTDTVAGGAVGKSCIGEGPPNDRAQLTGAAVADLINRIMSTVAPSYEQRPLDLMTADAGLPAHMQKNFDAARDFARARRMDEACSRFQSLYDDMKESVALIYNMAFCEESKGELLRANQGYRRASELLNAPNAQIDRRIAITEKALHQTPVAFSAVNLASSQAQESAPAGRAAPVGDGRRIALVIGNARYERSALINPVNDASLIGAKLKKIGFDVTVAQNVDSARFRSMVRDFAQRSKGADIALFYYAGHAIQSEGENLLMPVDNLKFKSADDLRQHGGIALQADVFGPLDAAAPRVKVIVLDACRDNPLPNNGRRGLGSAGLADIKVAPEGSLIAFATAPGQPAEDGTGKNSVFTKHLAAEVDKPNQTLEQIFKRVRESVRKETKNKQEPMEYSALVGDVYLVRAR